MDRTLEQESLRRDRGVLLAELVAAGVKVRGNSFACPWHEDAHPSCSIFRTEKGAWRFRCHVCNIGGDVFDAKAKLTGKPLGEVLAESRPAEREHHPEPPPRLFPSVAAMIESRSRFSPVDATYVYGHPVTRAAEMVVMRCRDVGGKKTFLQARPVDGGFVMQAPTKPWPLYNRIRVIPADTVFVVEGEKCVHALHDIDIVATTSPGGAGKAQYADWSPLAGKIIYLWPDADESDTKTGRNQGIEHMRLVAKELEKLEPPPQVWWIPADQFGLPPKGDVVEFIEIFGGDDPKRAVLGVIELAEPLGATAGLQRLLEDTISGKRKAIHWPWLGLTRLSKALLPGTVTILGGDPGTGKSFLKLEAVAYWHGKNERVADYELEDDKAYHLNRVLAQRANNAGLVDDEWVRSEPDATREAMAAHREFLEGLGRRMSDAPDEPPTLEQLTAWVRHQCSAGSSLIVIDPITAAATSDKPWIDDLKFMMAAKMAVRESGARLILVTHPRKGGRNGGRGLDELAGGAAYQRFSHTVLWLVKHDTPKDVKVMTAGGVANEKINRSLQIRKARNGRGGGQELAFNFDGTRLRFKEYGVVVGDGDEAEDAI